MSRNSDANILKMETNYFGMHLAKLRRKNKLKQKQVAYEAAMDPSYVAALENGRRFPPRKSLMTSLARAVKANEQEEVELLRAAMLSEIARGVEEYAENFAGAELAMEILELSSVLSPNEIQALSTLVEGYRFRAYVQGRNEM